MDLNEKHNQVFLSKQELSTDSVLNNSNACHGDTDIERKTLTWSKYKSSIGQAKKGAKILVNACQCNGSCPT